MTIQTVQEEQQETQATALRSQLHNILDQMYQAGLFSDESDMFQLWNRGIWAGLNLTEILQRLNCDSFEDAERKLQEQKSSLENTLNDISTLYVTLQSDPEWSDAVANAYHQHPDKPQEDTEATDAPAAAESVTFTPTEPLRKAESTDSLVADIKAQLLTLQRKLNRSSIVLPHFCEKLAALTSYQEILTAFGQEDSADESTNLTLLKRCKRELGGLINLFKLPAEQVKPAIVGGLTTLFGSNAEMKAALEADKNFPSTEELDAALDKVVEIFDEYKKHFPVKPRADIDREFNTTIRSRFFDADTDSKEKKVLPVYRAYDKSYDKLRRDHNISNYLLDKDNDETAIYANRSLYISQLQQAIDNAEIAGTPLAKYRALQAINTICHDKDVKSSLEQHRHPILDKILAAITVVLTPLFGLGPLVSKHFRGFYFWGTRAESTNTDMANTLDKVAPIPTPKK